jgi:hypothetical protein
MRETAYIKISKFRSGPAFFLLKLLVVRNFITHISHPHDSRTALTLTLTLFFRTQFLALFFQASFCSRVIFGFEI